MPIHFDSAETNFRMDFLHSNGGIIVSSEIYRSSFLVASEVSVGFNSGIVIHVGNVHKIPSIPTVLKNKTFAAPRQVA